MMCAIIYKYMIDRPLLSQRLKESYDYLKSIGEVHTITEFAERIGKKQSGISNALACRGRVMTLGLLERVADAFPDVLNRDYLLKGEGELVKPDRQLRPHFDIGARAGFMDGISEGVVQADMREAVAGVSDYDFSIEVSGDSMMPRIEDGDTLLCRMVTDRMNLPLGKICVVDSKDGVVVKVVESAEKGLITLHSLNPSYRDYEIEYDTVNQIAEVVGMIRNL